MARCNRRDSMGVQCGYDAREGRKTCEMHARLKRQSNAREYAKRKARRSQQPATPDWMKDPALLPKRPPTKGGAP